MDKEINKCLAVLLKVEKGNMMCLEKEIQVAIFLKSDGGGEKDEAGSLSQRDNNFKRL